MKIKDILDIGIYIMIFVILIQFKINISEIKNNVEIIKSSIVNKEEIKNEKTF